MIQTDGKEGKQDFNSIYFVALLTYKWVLLSNKHAHDKYKSSAILPGSWS